MMAYSYVRVPGKSIVYHRRHGQMRGGSAQIVAEGMQPPMHAFDLRAVGLINLQEYLSQQPYEQFLTFLNTSRPPTSLRSERAFIEWNGLWPKAPTARHFGSTESRDSHRFVMKQPIGQFR